MQTRDIISIASTRSTCCLLFLALLLIPAIPAWGGETVSQAEFNAYWYAGKAEITSYSLQQARYGEMRDGHAVLVFVSEDFSRSKQVKLDNPSLAGDDRVPILKMNMDKKFHTGVYPYSMMTSAFTPMDDGAPHALKVTTSSQEWCGHTFTQLNRQDDDYRLREFSYFESEGDIEAVLEDAVLEDDLWNWIRLRPEALPLGELKVVPGSMYMRLKHVAWGAQQAEASLEDDPDEATLMIYRLQYPKLRRQLSITFSKAFPHTIEVWEEEYVDGWGRGAQRMVTKGERLERLQLDYWSKNRVIDDPLRQQLRLP